MSQPFASPDPAGLPVEAPRRVSKLWWVLCALLFIAACGLGIGGCAQFIGANTPDEASTFDVPGRGSILVEETGTYRIRYQSDRFTETGVCRIERRQTGTGSDRRTTTDTICDPSLLALEGEPVVRPPGGGDRLALDNGDAGVLRINDEITVTVWTFEADEVGTYQVESDAPLGTQRLVVEPDEFGLEGLLLVLLAVPVFLAAVVLLIVTGLRSSSRKRRRNQAAFQAAAAHPSPMGTAPPGSAPPGPSPPSSYPPAPPPP
ncbi:MAG: hypothetical protein JNK12_10170 [Acidimicrobiales bacterium]|nr:hypothetical protein [Acidimicrobiales bacterium]